MVAGSDRGRPWQLMMTGSGAADISPGTREALATILDLLTELPDFTVHTHHGIVHVSRDFSRNYVRHIDKTIAGIFKKDPAIDAIEFPGHMATREDPHILSSGKSLREIVSKLKSGEISRDLMRDMLSTLFTHKRGD